MRRAGIAVFAVAATLYAPPVDAQRNWDDVKIEAIAVAEGIHMLTGAGGNIGVCEGPDGVFVIDDQFAPLSERIMVAIRELNPGPIRFLLNTHWHGDHVGGNENFAKAGVVIVAHDKVREAMSADQVRGGRTVPAAPEAALPIVTFSDEITFHMNGHTVHAVHFPPAHTDGDALVHFVGDNVIHSGDLVFNGRYPVIDGSRGGSVAGMIAATERIVGMCDADTRVIPGHGPLTDRAGVQAFHDMLVQVNDRLSKLKAQGLTVEQVKDAKPLADLDEAWGAGRGSDGFIDMAWPTIEAAGR